MDVATPHPDVQANSPTPVLTFSLLYTMVTGYVARSTLPKPSRWERWSLAGLGLLVAALHGSVLPAKAAAVALRTCLVVELAGFAAHLVLLAIREMPQFLKPRLTHAEEMDADFAYWQQLLAQLRVFPRDQREGMLQYAAALHQRMNDRMGLMYGGVQKLGVFPVLIALYLQFRNWKWGDCTSAFDVNLVAGLLSG